MAVDPARDATAPTGDVPPGAGAPRRPGNPPAVPRGTVPPRIMAAFRRYKVAAYVVGWGLLILCACALAGASRTAPRTAGATARARPVTAPSGWRARRPARRRTPRAAR